MTYRFSSNSLNWGWNVTFKSWGICFFRTIAITGVNRSYLTKVADSNLKDHPRFQKLRREEMCTVAIHFPNFYHIGCVGF